MRRSLSTRCAQVFFAASAMAFLDVQGAGADSVGVAGAANTQAVGIPPGGASRIVEIGEQVVRNERIQTSSSGSVQVLFIDKSTLSVGPNSNLIIDSFVFDPNTSQGQMAISLTKGVIRLVGGQATHTGGATITTADASIGIRGGILTVQCNKELGTEAILGFGKMTVASGCGATNQSSSKCSTKTVTRPGFGTITKSAEAGTSEPVRMTSSQIDQSNALLTSATGQTGGSSVQPSDQQAATYNVGAASSPASSPPAAGPTKGNGGNTTPTLVETIPQTAQQNTAANATAQTLPPLLPPAPPTGIATYTGTTNVNINNNGSLYAANGTFSNTVNFGARTGAVAIFGLDNTTYAGAVRLTPSSTTFAGSLVGNVGGRTAAINGGFLTTPPAYSSMAGSIGITGTNYLGTGTFAATKH